MKGTTNKNSTTKQPSTDKDKQQGARKSGEKTSQTGRK